MNKTELISALAKKQGVTKKAAGESIDALVAVIADSLVDGENVKIPGLGTFKIIEVAEKRGVIHMGEKNGQEYIIPSHNKVSFKISATLKEAVK